MGCELSSYLIGTIGGVFCVGKEASSSILATIVSPAGDAVLITFLLEVGMGMVFKGINIPLPFAPYVLYKAK